MGSWSFYARAADWLELLANRLGKLAGWLRGKALSA